MYSTIALFESNVRPPELTPLSQDSNEIPIVVIERDGVRTSVEYTALLP